jgi:2-C-methyl-D-erythritol 4-phosphate cytidylyltransferase / 2-C-methyl-D-erythritol 2,4-cyclodiphosphate synthase
VSVAAVVVAGGRGIRFGGPKQFLPLGSVSMAAHAVLMARTVADVVVLVVPNDYTGSGEGADLVVVGGTTRSDSVRAGLAVLPAAEVVVIHDAVRPLASAELFLRVVNAVLQGADAAIPALAVTDTVKRVVEHTVVGTLERDELVTVQTPQAFRRVALVAAHESVDVASDDAALVEATGGRVVIVEGERDNIKITEPGDVERLRLLRGVSMKIGHGIDVHRFSSDANRTLWIGLTEVTGSIGLAGHSDADVATHALCDALLGAANLGDLGRHFPDTDPQWRDVSSRVLLTKVMEQLSLLGYRVVSADVTIVAEQPKLVEFMPKMAKALSDLAGCVVSVKATTTEGLGAVGRGEGIAANAVVLLEEFS